MSHPRRSYRLQAGLTSLVLACLLLVPQAASAQLINPDDPCYQTWTTWGKLSVLTDIDWDETDRMAEALIATNNWTAVVKAALEKRNAEGTPLSATERAERAKLRDCMPRLRALIERLNDEMDRAGINTLETGNQRGAEARAPTRKEIVARLLAALLLVFNILTDR